MVDKGTFAEVSLRPALLAVLLVACNPSGGGADFASGNFQLTTQDVNDGCLDGGMEVLFMPEGTPNDFASTIYIPALDELPATYNVDIQDPFNDMEVTVTGDADTRTVTGAENNGVEFDADTYPGCLIDNSIDVDLTIDSADDMHGTATLHANSFDEGSCPVVTDDPCDIVLTLTATRQ
jgi:hypothetical protein